MDILIAEGAAFLRGAPAWVSWALSITAGVLMLLVLDFALTFTRRLLLGR